MINVRKYLVLQRFESATHPCLSPHLSPSLLDEDSIVLQLMYKSAVFMQDREIKIGSRGIVSMGMKELIEEHGKDIRITHIHRQERVRIPGTS